MGGSVREVQPRSQATPLSGGVLGLLEGQLFGLSPEQLVELQELDRQIARAEELAQQGGPIGESGRQTLVQLQQRRQELVAQGEGDEFGRGVGPLQQEAAQLLQQFIEGGAGQFDLSPLFAQLEEIQTRRTDEQAADLREGFGITGGRFGTPLAVGESRLRRDLESEFAATLGELSRVEFSNQQQRLLAAIGGLQAFGQQNVEPFFRFAQQGIFPSQFAIEQNPFITFLNAAAGVAGGTGQFLSGVQAGNVPGTTTTTTPVRGG